MATIRRRGRSWHVQVRRLGLPALTRSFQRRSDAELWARQREGEIDRGDLPVNTRALRAHTLRSLLERYAETVTPKKRGAAQERYKLRVVLQHSISELSLDRLTPSEVAKYRDDRLEQVVGDTVRRELALIQHCLEPARREWGICLMVNPVRQIKLPTIGRSRERRATAGELAQLMAACAGARCYWLAPMIQMAVETGMRRSELLSIRWTEVDLGSRTIYVANSKNGHPRTIPLSSVAVEALGQVPRTGERVFPVTGNAFRLAWERLRKRAASLAFAFTTSGTKP